MNFNKETSEERATRYTNKILEYSAKYPNIDFSKSVYTGSKGMMTATCKIHGIEITKKGSHWNINGCPDCGRDRMKVRIESRYDGFRKTSNAVKERFKVKWDKFVSENSHDGSILDFSRVIFVNSTTNIEMVCKEHSEVFVTTPKRLMNGVRCRKCKVSKPMGSDYYKEKILSSWGNTYKYEYIPEYRHEKVIAHCGKHGRFEVWLNNHLVGAGCPMCTGKMSKPEHELAEYIRGLGFDVTMNRRNIISPKEIDVFVDGKNIGFEMDGLWWHAEGRSGDSLRQKWEMANDIGVRLIQIFEDEWIEKKDIIKSRIANVLGVSERTYARKCLVREVSSEVANTFHKLHHISGASGGIHTALFHDDHMVATLTMKFHSGKWEVMRYSSEGTVVGGFTKLFSYFVRTNNPEQVISYCDLRYGNGGVYEKAGFMLDGITQPDYFWFKKRVRYSRHSFQKHKLRESPEFKDIYSDNKTEKEMCTEAGYSRIFGVGHMRWIWNRKLHS